MRVKLIIVPFSEISFTKKTLKSMGFKNEETFLLSVCIWKRKYSKRFVCNLHEGSFFSVPLPRIVRIVYFSS